MSEFDERGWYELRKNSIPPPDCAYVLEHLLDNQCTGFCTKLPTHSITLEQMRMKRKIFDT